MRIMVDKNASLCEVLEKMGNRNGVVFPVHLYVFKSYNDEKKQQRKMTEEKTTDNSSNEMLQYKSICNANVFDMNMEVRNLPSFDLELTERLFAETKLQRSLVNISSKSFAGPYSEEFDLLPTEKNTSPKMEYEFLYNNITASRYIVLSSLIYRNLQEQG